MNELELIIDLHKNSERQGPGSENETLLALQLIDFPAETDVKVVDIGCGTGGQTLTLAKNLNGQITAVDLFPEFLDKLSAESEKLGLTDKISTLKRSMDNLPFHKDEFDLIWSEGAIYNIGFENGLKQWKDYLKPGGYLAVSEITWITQSRPKEIEEFWNREYPEINTASVKINQLEKHGYSLVGYFYLSEDSWLDNYYKRIQLQFEAFLQRHQQAPLAKKVVDDYQAEIDLYLTFKEYYSYGFYIAQKSKLQK
jgi:SAM-dependent methyltransferase